MTYVSRYFKPGSMGKASPQRRRFSHISVVLEINKSQKQTKRFSMGQKSTS